MNVDRSALRIGRVRKYCLLQRALGAHSMGWVVPPAFPTGWMEGTFSLDLL